MSDLALNDLMDDSTDGPSLVHLPHPLNQAGKVLSYAPFLPGETVEAYLRRTGVQVSNAPVHVWHNGRMVPAALWRRLIPRTGDLILIRAKMEGGGGGNKVLRTVAMVAVVAAAVITQQYYAIPGATGMLGMSAATTGSLLSAGIMIGGSLVVSPLIPEISP